MTDYIHLRIELAPCSETATDLLAAFLADIGYDSFVSDDAGISAYIPRSGFNIDEVEEILADFPMETEFSVSTETVEGKDWNEVWEKNYFQPIVVGGECVIHSTFHKDVPDAKYDIVIDPRMAFGTGHHATTSLMIEYLLSIPMEGKTIIDMGTGTGILAILSSMLGANSITAIEIDPDAADNARDHLILNEIANVEVITGDATSLPDSPTADLFIANINRNIILADLEDYVKSVKPGGTFLFSGFYTEDIPILQSAAESFGLKLLDYKTRDNWTALRFISKSLLSTKNGHG